MANKDDRSRYLTTGERIRNFTGWAFALAIFLELIALPFYHSLNQVQSGPTEKPFTIAKQTIKPPPTPPPPTPTPPPTPQPRQTPQHVVHPNPRPLLVHPPPVHSQGAGSQTQTHYTPPPNASVNGNPQGTATASPAAATPASCPNPNREATVISKATADYPQSAQELNLGDVTVEIKVTVGASGTLQDATVYSSSHNMAIDQAALRAARESTYAPKLVNCVPTVGIYLFDVTFTMN
ncbi:MAG: energy transducer TonB [Candidatus Tyrphobacter sp.]